LFLYESFSSNPNADLEGNIRIDSATNKLSVSGFRIKRTLREYWMKGITSGSVIGDVWVNHGRNVDNTSQTVSDRLQDYNENYDKIVFNCIDARIFGIVIPNKNKDK
jgi:Cas7 group CRISPR-associated protein Csh2